MFSEFTEDDKFYIPCPDYNYARNLVKYLTTDFARVCLSFCKHNIDLIQNRSLRFVPWQDFQDDDMFSGTISDVSDFLFMKYRIILNKAQRKFISEKFPSVYDNI